MWASITLPPLHLNIFDDDQFKVFIKNIKQLYDETDYCITLLVGCGFIEPSMFVRDFPNFMMDIYLDRKGVEKLLDQYLEGHMKFLDRVLKGVEKYIDVLIFSDDLGSNEGPFMSEDKFKTIFKPKYKKMYDFVHDNSNCKTFLHTCGSILEMIPHLIDAGLDILNPVQTNAKGMDPHKLKREFGKDIVFWGGGVDTRNVLPSKNPKEVKEDVKRRIDIFAKDGGFVFAPIHNVQADAPPENIVAMLEAAYEFGFFNK
jgi:uroporphyrinogen decarboxylase